MADVERLRPVDVATISASCWTPSDAAAALDGRAAVIGLAGGPFTLAAYCIEGGPSRDQLAARRLADGAPEVWAALVDRLTDATIAYVRAQVTAGAQVIQLFDSWAGALTAADYERLVAPWTRRILDAIRAAGAPAIHFAAAGANLLERLGPDADVVALDGAQSLRPRGRDSGRPRSRATSTRRGWRTPHRPGRRSTPARARTTGVLPRRQHRPRRPARHPPGGCARSCDSSTSGAPSLRRYRRPCMTTPTAPRGVLLMTYGSPSSSTMSSGT